MKLELKNPADKEILTINKGRAEGPLTGGCLSIVAATLGTKHELDAKDKILFSLSHSCIMRP